MDNNKSKRRGAYRRFWDADGDSTPQRTLINAKELEEACDRFLNARLLQQEKDSNKRFNRKK